MQDLHWRYNPNVDQLEYIERNPRQHYQPLLKNVSVPTLVIDINLISPDRLKSYCLSAIDRATRENIRFDQIIYEGTMDPIVYYEETTQILDTVSLESGIKSYLAHVRFSVKSHQNLIEFIYPSQMILLKQRPKLPFNDQLRQYKFSCLNRNPSMHRLLLYTLIKDRGLLKDFIYTFYDHCPYNGFKYTAHHYKNLLKYVNLSMYDRCLRNLADFPLQWKNEKNGGNNDHGATHDAFSDCWCHIVTETSATIPYASEKLWKPISSGQLFFVAGSAGILSWLKSLGFYTFYDNYDCEVDIEKRFQMIVDRIEEQQKNPQIFWEQNKFQIEHNYHWFYSGNVEKILLDPIINQLNHKY